MIDEAKVNNSVRLSKNYDIAIPWMFLQNKDWRTRLRELIVEHKLLLA